LISEIAALCSFPVTVAEIEASFRSYPLLPVVDERTRLVDASDLSADLLKTKVAKEFSIANTTVHVSPNAMS
jgi:hypothetical protein